MEIVEQSNGSENWVCYQWFSSLVLDPEALEEYRQSVDERTYLQEMEGAVQAYEGVLYYTFDRAVIWEINLTTGATGAGTKDGSAA